METATATEKTLMKDVVSRVLRNRKHWDPEGQGLGGRKGSKGMQLTLKSLSGEA